MKLNQTQISKRVLTAPACYQTPLSLLKKSAQLVCDTVQVLTDKFMGMGKAATTREQRRTSTKSDVGVGAACLLLDDLDERLSEKISRSGSSVIGSQGKKWIGTSPWA